MVRDSIKRLVTGRSPKGPKVPYGMFDLETSVREANAARRLERIYHKGQVKAWDGKQVLADLVAEHGPPSLPPEKLHALQRLLAVIFWGELAAWKVASKLALEIEPLEAKMAATSQAHDEARHFYVLHDYLQLIGYTPEHLPPAAAEILSTILDTDSLAKQLIGMQLMVEPIALTLFQMLREAEIEPVLCGLMPYYEKDEARHVGLGINYLPYMFKKMGRRETLDTWAFQYRMVNCEVRGMVDLQPDFAALGFSPRDVVRLGTSKQLRASEMLAEELGADMPVAEIFTRIAEAQIELRFPLDGQRNDPLSRGARAAKVLAFGPDQERLKSELSYAA